MQAKVIKDFPGLVDGDSQVRTVKVGETISGELARVAVREKWAEEASAKSDDGGGAPDLHGMTNAELKDYAETHNIDLGDATKKADIIAAIELAGEAKS